LGGVTGYCRIWILGYADLARPLYQILKEAQKETQLFIEWDEKSENAFHRLKKALITAPVLGLPVQENFQLYVYEKGGLALGVVTQLWGITPQSVGYLSKELDQVAKGRTGCLRAMAAVSLLVLVAQKLTLNFPLTGFPSRVSGSPCIPQYAVYLFSSLQIKSFRPLLLESTCVFIPRAGSRTLSI
jgi:hypothetical protein